MTNLFLQMSKDLRETSAQAYQDVVMQMEARKWANDFNKQGVPKPVISSQMTILNMIFLLMLNELNTPATNIPSDGCFC